ncbi:hypothetical protein [Lacrimispora sp.]|uniref:hypothetical protein n=1 Tax=Lacrimispora sp. TaxID=2719234 RepID=UPI00289924A5|nr:hypothetical protein [Lacrimispora sp.]
MRIISQSGTDYPYEQICIQIQNNQIKCKTCNSERVDLLANYSSAEKAQKVMEMLHREYVGIMPSLIISDCGFSQTDLEELKQSMVGGQIMVPSQGEGHVEYHMLPRIFRFPADDEIEVEE